MLENKPTVQGPFVVLLFMFCFCTGCLVTDNQQTREITAYTGGSVELPCFCAQPQPTVKWQFDRFGRWIAVFEDEKYSGRRMLFDESPPKNMSLLISDLRKEDEGDYNCLNQGSSSIFISLTVKGCNLVNKEVTLIGYTGESVVLPCSCAELLAKPEHIQWMHFIENNYKEIYPKEEIESHKNRVKLLNQTTPGNLSLHISALTTNDGGIYCCTLSLQQTVLFRLHVTEKPHVQTISLSTHQPSYQTQERKPPQPQNTPQYVFILTGLLSVLVLALLVFIYWRCNKGGRNSKKVSCDVEETKTEPDKQDDVMYSAVVHLKTAHQTSRAAHVQTDPADLTMYAAINVKH